MPSTINDLGYIAKKPPQPPTTNMLPRRQAAPLVKEVELLLLLLRLRFKGELAFISATSGYYDGKTRKKEKKKKRSKETSGSHYKGIRCMMYDVWRQHMVPA
jgi:hypothetical protein